MALRHVILAVAGAAAFSFPAIAVPPTPTSAYLPTTCQPGVAGDCVRAIPVANPDGSSIGGSAYTGPAAAQLPASLGTKTVANSLAVAPASDALFGLAAGTNVIGKVGIDQTTPGTTNLVFAQGQRFGTIIAPSTGAITAGGTSQAAFSSNPARAYLMCQNPITASETLYVDVGTAASATGNSYELAPGASLTFSNNFIPTGSVNVMAATAAHRFICKQG